MNDEILPEHAALLRHLRGIRYIVINIEEGGRFDLSKQAQDLYLELSGISYSLEPQSDRDSQNKFGSRVIVDNNYWYCNYIDRDDPVLINIVRKLGSDANTVNSTLKIVEIPYDVQWFIDEYDGREWVAEQHRTWS